MFPLLAYFDQISLSQEQILTITHYLREIHQSEEQFYKESMDALRKEQEKLQKRISQIYEDKLDGIIDEKMYLEKIREYKKKQAKGITRLWKAIRKWIITFILYPT